MIENRQPPPLRFRWWGMTHKGRFRPNNEDAFLGLTFDAREIEYLGKEGASTMRERDFVWAVSDGMGGANAGEFASRIAVQKITELLPSAFRLAASGMRRGGVEMLEELVFRIHREMVAMGQHYEECAGMGATLSLCWFTPEKMFFAHVGDTRIYYLPAEGGMMQVTQDHTHVGWLLRQGKITEYEARSHPARNRLEMSLGGKRSSIDPQLGQVLYQPGDRFVICSDGVSEGIGSRILEDILRNPSPRLQAYTPAQRLIEEAMALSRDNMTAIVIEVTAAPADAEECPPGSEAGA